MSRMTAASPPQSAPPGRPYWARRASARLPHDPLPLSDVLDDLITLLRAVPPLCPASVLCRSQCPPLAVLPLAARRAPLPQSPGRRYRGDRFSSPAVTPGNGLADATVVFVTLPRLPGLAARLRHRYRRGGIQRDGRLGRGAGLPFPVPAGRPAVGQRLGRRRLRPQRLRRRRLGRRPDRAGRGGPACHEEGPGEEDAGEGGGCEGGRGGPAGCEEGPGEGARAKEAAEAGAVPSAARRTPAKKAATGQTAEKAPPATKRARTLAKEAAPEQAARKAAPAAKRAGKTAK